VENILKLTNNYGAPDSIVDAIRSDPYTKGDADFSATELLKPPQIVRLYKKHEDTVTTDVRDEWWKLLGKGVHTILEQPPECEQCYGKGVLRDHGEEMLTPILAKIWERLLEGLLSINPKIFWFLKGESRCDSCGGTGLIDDGKIREKRFFAECEGVKISGAMDLLDDDGAVTDYKVTSVFTIQRGLKPDWEQQLNIYAWLLRQNDITVTSLTIVGLCRDWMKSRAEAKADYPQSPIVLIKVPLWRPERQDDFVAGRVRVHTMEKTIPCTPEERWARGAYQVNPMHGGGGKPRSFDTLQDVTDYINNKKTGSYKIIDGDAKYVRCESWCEVAEFCPQWKGG
jgi:hypothetical protein